MYPFLFELNQLVVTISNTCHNTRVTQTPRNPVISCVTFSGNNAYVSIHWRPVFMCWFC